MVANSNLLLPSPAWGLRRTKGWAQARGRLWRIRFSSRPLDDCPGNSAHARQFIGLQAPACEKVVQDSHLLTVRVSALSPTIVNSSALMASLYVLCPSQTSDITRTVDVK